MEKNTAQILQKYPMFIVTFQAGTDLREIYKTTKLCHCIVKWERYKAKRPIQQCFNCQKFGHSSAYCGRPAKCVKCNKPHNTQDCQKLPCDPPICVNCGGDYPANYSGSPEYRKILASRNRKKPSQQSRPPNQPSTRSQFPPLSQPRIKQHQERTWAQIAVHTPGPQDDQTLPSVLGSIKSILSSLNLQTISVALRTLALRLHKARDPLDKMMFIIDTIMTCFVTSP
jgi:hypothetical protein